MTNSFPFAAHGGQRSAYIRDESLILYFETAETPLVARFDLNTLAQANFEVVKNGEGFALMLRDFSGQHQTITTFASKVDAHQALHAILQALLSYGEDRSDMEKKPGVFRRLLKWIAITAIILIAAYVTLLWMATPTVHSTKNEASVVSNLPEGEPVNLDQLFQNAPPETGEAASTAEVPPAASEDKPSETEQPTAEAASESESHTTPAE